MLLLQQKRTAKVGKRPSRGSGFKATEDFLSNNHERRRQCTTYKSQTSATCRQAMVDEEQTSSKPKACSQSGVRNLEFDSAVLTRACVI
ncbi:MAG TPA: hypothetical protein DCX46_02655 [Bacteroidetes bacterium]|nr:hypothetical protein [Bacteroidota bacterium]